MEKTIKSKNVKFKYENGFTADGKQKYAYNTISNVDKQVSDEILFAMIPVIAKVQKAPSTQVEVVQTVVLK